MGTAQSKDSQNDFLQNLLCQFWLKNYQVLIKVSLPIFTMFHSQTTKIQPSERFSTKMLKFQQYDVVIYDVSVDFTILVSM